MSKEDTSGQPSNEKSAFVYSIFSTIAPKYDLLNTILSCNRDTYWRKKAVELAELSKGNIVLDVCCGTGKVAFESFFHVKPTGKVYGIDFCEKMLEIAARNTPNDYMNNFKWLKGDAMSLPFPDNFFNASTIAFALRNVPDIKRTIKEMQRVVKPGGKVVSLELAKPTKPILKNIYYFYFNHLMPCLGNISVGKAGPYNYLSNSLKKFPHQEEIKEIFKETGLKDVFYLELTGGIVAVHVGKK